jgi:hypothetical protein
MTITRRDYLRLSGLGGLGLAGQGLLKGWTPPPRSCRR